jgi:hypothetical protein
MEFLELTSSPEALNSLGELLGLQKVKPVPVKSKKDKLKEQLNRINKLNSRVVKKLESIKVGFELIGVYKKQIHELLITSKEIISKLEIGDDLDVKEDLETP